jgi:zinc protease
MKGLVQLGCLLLMTNACRGAHELRPTERTAPQASGAVAKLIERHRQHLKAAHAPGLVRGILPNGLTLYVWQAEVQEPVSLLQVEVGGAYERPAERGYAHLVEHMAFVGTAHFPGGTLDEASEALGLTKWEDVNGWTYADHTLYQFETAGGDREGLTVAISALRDIAQTVQFDEKRLESERKVVAEELLMMPPWSSYFSPQLREKLSPPEVKQREIANVRAATPRALRAFYKKWYEPSRMAVVVVSPWSARDLYAQLSDLFGTLPPGSNGATLPEEVDSRAPIAVEIRHDPEASIGFVEFHDIAPSIASGGGAINNDAALIRSWLCTNLLRKRLASALRETRDRGVRLLPVRHAQRADGTALRELVFSYAQGELLRSVERVSEELARVETFGFTPEEFLQTRAQIIRSIETLPRRWRRLSGVDRGLELLRNFSTGELVRGEREESRALLEQAQSLTTDDCRACAAPFPEANRSVQAFVTDADSSVDNASLSHARNQARPIENWVARPTYGEDLIHLRVVPEVVGEIVSDQKEAKGRAERLILSNGVTVLLKPTQFEPGRFAIHGEQEGGFNHLSRPAYSIALVASRIMPVAGSSRFGPLEFDRASAELGIEAALWLSDYRHGMRATAPTGQLSTALKALYLLTASPGNGEGFSAVDFADHPSPSALLDRAVGIAKRGPNGRSAVLTEAMAEQVAFSDILALWTSIFKNANGFRFAVVGDFDVEEAKRAVSAYLGGLPAAAKPPSPPTPTRRWYQYDHVPLLGGRAGSDPYNRVELGFQARLHTIELSRPYAEVVERIVERRLTRRLRGELGSTYHVHVSLTIEEPYVALEIKLNTSIEDVRVIHAAVLEELHNLAVAGPNDVELQNVIHQLEVAHQSDLETNAWWAETLLAYEAGGFEAHARVEPVTVWRSMNPEHFQRTIRAFMDGQQYRAVVRPNARVRP